MVKNIYGPSYSGNKGNIFLKSISCQNEMHGELYYSYSRTRT